MGSTWGKNIKLSLFGESHGVGIGITIDGLPSGIELDLDAIRIEMKRRATGKNKLTTARKEADEFEILSGYFNGYTTGAPLSIVIRNRDQKSRDYSKIKDIARPAHADYTGNQRYNGFNDYRGGGHFSGRLTAPIVFAGAIAKQILAKEGIFIGSHIKTIKDIEDRNFNEQDLNRDNFIELSKEQLPFLNEEIREKAKDLILEARSNHDSVGGIIECGIIGMKPGIGNPFFNSIESQLASLMYSIPAVKGVEFGTGFEITKLYGSEANDNIYIKDEKVVTSTNHNGGILGGISNGMPINFKVAIKPTPSISKAQDTINMKTNEETKFEIVGRHDPCIVPRALVVVEAMTAIGILDFIRGC
ncbi:MAG: chorismate synthase [Fusobacteria bacterium]|nr:MAG: chorismate synthase [Fusobacteriota bacterium]